MKQLKKSICTLLMLLALFCGSAAVLSCATPITAEAATIKINKTKLTLNKGKTYQLKVTGTQKKVTWKSNKPSVASINSKGKVTAKKAGTAKITATVSGKKYTCTVIVIKKTNVKFSASTTNLTIHPSGNRNTINITFNGNGNVLFNVKDDSICSCQWDEKWNNDTIKLNITGWKPGKTYILITNSIDKRKIKINVTVKKNITTLDKNDFIAKLPSEKRTINIIDELRKEYGESSYYYFFYDASVDNSKKGVINTKRGIHIGDTKQNVIDAYGKTNSNLFIANNSGLYHEFLKDEKEKAGIMRTQCITYVSYDYDNIGTIEFYFDENDLVSWIIFYLFY